MYTVAVTRNDKRRQTKILPTNSHCLSVNTNNETNRLKDNDKAFGAVNSFIQNTTTVFYFLIGTELNDCLTIRSDALRINFNKTLHSKFFRYK